MQISLSPTGTVTKTHSLKFLKKSNKVIHSDIISESQICCPSREGDMFPRKAAPFVTNAPFSGR